jgi:hypothetical protein
VGRVLKYAPMTWMYIVGTWGFLTGGMTSKVLSVFFCVLITVMTFADIR